jgi:uncharacterized membrane protein
MITLILLLTVFVVSLFVLKLFKMSYSFVMAGRLAMAAMLLFTGISHFVFIEGMSHMLPEFVPFRETVILVTGALEIMGAIGLLRTRTQKISSLLLILFLIAILPANIYASMNHINYQTGGYDERGPAYLWIRIPIQLVFIAWLWYFGYRKAQNQSPVSRI